MAFILGSCATAATQKTVALDQGSSVEQVRRAVKMALAGRHWAVEKEQPGEIQAALSRPDMSGDTAVATINYTQETVTITPGNVRRGGASDTSSRIAPHHVERWIANLAKDIPVHLQRERIRSEPPLPPTDQNE